MGFTLHGIDIPLWLLFLLALMARNRTNKTQTRKRVARAILLIRRPADIESLWP
jgi:hypothetical protein